MKALLICIFLFIALPSSAQNKQISKRLRIIAIEDTSYAYLLKGVTSMGTDTFHFISLKNYGELKVEAQKIDIGQEYLFVLDDMDYKKGLFTRIPAEGYTIMFDSAVFVKRHWRHGKSFTETQFRSVNTKGLWVNKIE